MKSKLSLLRYCISCKAKCCKISKKIGSPILCEREAAKLKKINPNAIKKVKTKYGEYFILKEKKNKECPFLFNLKCKTEKIKPLDCLCYPIKAVWKKDEIKFITDKDCPAHKKLSKTFIKEAKKIALKSIKRFNKQTYNHWLKNNVGWVN